MLGKKLVSAIIPTYNRSETVCNAIESVLQQTYKNIEIIVVDDGSTDNTLDKLAIFGNRIQLLRQENSGPSAARNRGVKISHGEIITFLDSDDLWVPTKIEQQVNILENVDESVPCCLCNAIIQRNSEEKETSFAVAPLHTTYDKGLWLNVTDILSTRCVFFTQAISIRRSCFEKLGGFDESLWIMEDYDLALRLSLEGPWAFIHEPLVIYHQGIQGSLANEAQRNKLELYKNIEKIFSKILKDNRIDVLEARRHLTGGLSGIRFYIRMAQKYPKIVVRLLALFMRAQSAVFHRSPKFPRMKNEPLD